MLLIIKKKKNLMLCNPNDWEDLTKEESLHFCVLMDDWTLSWERRSNGIYLTGGPHMRQSTCVQGMPEVRHKLERRAEGRV